MIKVGDRIKYIPNGESFTPPIDSITTFYAKVNEVIYNNDSIIGYVIEGLKGNNISWSNIKDWCMTSELKNGGRLVVYASDVYLDIENEYKSII